MSNCRATFEKAETPSERDGTHTCMWATGHEPPHRCPRCGVDWMSAPGQRRNYIVEKAQA